MTDILTLPESGLDPDLRARSLAQLDRLDELAEIGMKAARLVGARAEQARPDEDLNALAMAYARAARAVRLCVLLHAKVVKDLRDGDRADGEAAEQAAVERRDHHRNRVEHLVWRKAQNAFGHDEVERIEKVMNEVSDRLDHEAVYGDLLTRPIHDVVAEMCREAGIETVGPPEPAVRAIAAGQDQRRAPTEAEWSEALAKAAVEAEKVLAELRADSS